MIEHWKTHYQNVPSTLGNLKNLNGVASVFNANIDAIVHVTPERFSKWYQSCHRPDLEAAKHREIQTPSDVLRGIFLCMKDGIAQEWLVTQSEAYQWIQQTLGFDRMQMGGQGGIIANVMSVCDIKNVYVHTASHGPEQAELFLDKANLLTCNTEGEMAPAHHTIRQNEIPLIHWILEFNKGDVFIVNDKTYTCPKSNRFIATYDPLNFNLHLVDSFSNAMKRPSTNLEVVLMSGFHMLSDKMSNGESGYKRVQTIWDEVKAWKLSHPHCMVHLEFASTQDLRIRRAIADIIAPEVDSIGLNEQELIDILEVFGQSDLASQCRQHMESIQMFKGCLYLYNKFKPYRLQLHMFGLYFTLTREKNTKKLISIRDGMALAATLAAAKAGTGTLENPDKLLWAQGKTIWGAAVKELEALSAYLQQEYGSNDFAQTGILQQVDFSIVALPTILVEKPLTLVGMGDTISSLSLVGSLV